MKILVALSGSSPNEAILNHIEKQTWGSDNTFMLLNVIEFTEGFTLLTEGALSCEIILSAEEKNSHAELKEARLRLLRRLAPSATVQTLCKRGNAAGAIIKTAVDWRADLIIVGNHGESSWQKVFKLSVAQAVISGAPCSVEVVRNQPEPNAGWPGKQATSANKATHGVKKQMKILLPIYSCGDAKLIMDFVGDFSWPPYACFKVIHVSSAAQLLPPEESTPTPPWQTVSLISYVKYRLKTIMPSVIAEYEMVVGDPTAKIIETADDWQADIIVMGSRTGEDNNWTVAGSVSQAVVLKAPCSVVTIKPSNRSKDKNITLGSVPIRNLASDSLAIKA